MNKMWASQLVAAEQARMSFTLLTVYCILFGTAMHCQQVEKWSGLISMSEEEKKTHDDQLAHIRWLGGTLCWIGGCGIHDEQHPTLVAAGVESFGSI